MGLGIGTRLVDGCEGCSGTLSRDTRRQRGQQVRREKRQELAKALGGEYDGTGRSAD